MVITVAPAGSVACRLKVSAPVAVSWTSNRRAPVAWRFTPVIAKGIRGVAAEGASVSVFVKAAARGCKAASSRAGWMP